MILSVSSSCSVLVALFVAVAVFSPVAVSGTEIEEFELCFSPPLHFSEDLEANAFAECFKEAYNIDHIDFEVESVELEVEDDDGEGDTRRDLGNNNRRKKSKKLKAKGTCRGRSCGSENGNVIEQSCPGCRLRRATRAELPSDAELKSRRILDIDFPTKTYTEHLVDDCVDYVFDHDGFLGDLVGGVTIGPCS